MNYIDNSDQSNVCGFILFLDRSLAVTWIEGTKKARLCCAPSRKLLAKDFYWHMHFARGCPGQIWEDQQFSGLVNSYWWHSASSQSFRVFVVGAVTCKSKCWRLVLYHIQWSQIWPIWLSYTVFQASNKISQGGTTWTYVNTTARRSSSLFLLLLV